MSGFTAETLAKKFSTVESSQQSIQTLSLWLIHHRKHNKTVVANWIKAVQNAKPSRKLTLVYLANDVIQTSRKKGPEYADEFSTVLKQALETIAKECDDKTWIGLARVLNVFEERGIYTPAVVSEWRKAIGTRSNVSEAELKSSKSRAASKAKREKEKKAEQLRKKHKASNSATPVASAVVKAPPRPAKPLLPQIPAPCDGVIIDPDALIKALSDLQSSATSDTSAREKIASFPPEVTDPTLVDKIRDKEQAEKLQRQVDSASTLLAEYNMRLMREMEDRKQVSIMLATYIKNQKDQVSISEQKLNEYKEKLKKVSQVRSELKSHMQNLPDLSLLPSVTGGLMPLPSAGDLFNMSGMSGGRIGAGGKYTSSLGSTSSASPQTASPADYESLSTPNS